MNGLEKLALKLWLRGKGKGDMGKKFKAAVEWLNEVPGRKRGVAAILLGTATVLQVYGHSDLAMYAQGLNSVIQTYVVPGCDIVGVVFAVLGLAHAKKKGQL